MTKRYLLVLLVAVGTVVSVQAQQHRHKRGRGVVEPPPVPKIFTYVNQMPRFSYREDVDSWLRSHIRYPDRAIENGGQGHVDVRFEIDAEGIVHTLAIQRSSGNADLDNEALRVINAMPRWYPAKANGNPIPYVMMLPVYFSINGH